MSYHLTPLDVCEALIAPAKDLGALAGFHRKSAYGWRPGSKWRDPGDLPARANRSLLKLARKRGIPLKADHLIFGASHDEIDHLREAMRTEGLPVPPLPQAMQRKVAAE